MLVIMALLLSDDAEAPRGSAGAGYSFYPSVGLDPVPLLRRRMTQIESLTRQRRQVRIITPVARLRPLPIMRRVPKYPRWKGIKRAPLKPSVPRADAALIDRQQVIQEAMRRRVQPRFRPHI